MKITQTDYEILANAIKKVQSNPECPTLDNYRKRELTDIRYAWDMFWYTGLRIGDSKGNSGDINLYSYLNDTHIETALLKIVGGKR